MKFKHLLIVFISILAVSCKSDPKELIVKTWTIEDIDVSAAMTKVPQESREMFKKSFADMVTKLKGKATNEFLADGKFKSYQLNYMNEWENQEGTWALSEDNKTLTITPKNGKPEEYTIVELTDDKLSFKFQEMVLKMVAKK